LPAAQWLFLLIRKATIKKILPAAQWLFLMIRKAAIKKFACGAVVNSNDLESCD
jgi:hypothetical protein